ncbi:MAG: RidA family protein [Candidatus Eisenbacteria bacterium]|uniref:RidA family protein n=1 Tax=Eiseniibacteriota bacterium TaxID=2212470 RepID=A0A956LZD5_UNCEI|nr:RidA family protein [Candidatus Eisenbacteria bacterium]
MQIRTITPTDVMKPIGPYSHVALAGPFITISGTAGVDPNTGELAGPDAYAQTKQILRSFRRMLAPAGSGMQAILHIHVFLLHMEDYEEMNRAYREEFPRHLPARTVVGVSALPKPGARLTMNANAVAMFADRPSAADALVVGAVERIGTAGVDDLVRALEAVPSGAIVPVELMMVFAAMQKLHARRNDLEHDAIVAEIRTLEPGGVFGLGCMAFKNLWACRPDKSVSDEAFNCAIDMLSEPRSADPPTREPR